MVQYQMAELEDIIKEGINIEERDMSRDAILERNTILVDRSRQDIVSSSNEIQMALRKRFKGKKAVYTTPDFSEIVKWILCTDSYKFCEKNIRSLSDEDVEAAWEFIDTVSVSSTRDTSALISSARGGRSAEGFRREHRKRPVVKWSRSMTGREMSRPTLVEIESDHGGSFRTIEDMIVEDCIHWVMKSEDPLGSALHISANIIERNKRSVDGRPH